MTSKISHDEAVKYMRESAIRAHLDGQGAKARQLAALALRKEANRSIIPVVNLRDISWAFYLLIYWILEEIDYSIVLEGAWEAFEKKRKQEDKPDENSMDSHWFALIGFLMDILQPNGTKWDKDIQDIRKIPHEFFSDKDRNNSETLSMILPLVIDFIYHIYPDKKEDGGRDLIWHSLCNSWELFANRVGNFKLKATLLETRRRLEKQHSCLLDSKAFPYIGDNAIETFWQAFYDAKIDDMKRIYRELVQLVYDDNDKFYPVQSLINISRPLFMWKVSSDQFPGFYRIQRLYMENPQWLFGRLRRVMFSEALNEAGYKAEKGEATGDSSVTLWRLPVIAEIVALRNWDLHNYMSAMKMQSQASLFWGLYPVDYEGKTAIDCHADELITGIFCAAKSMALQSDKTRHFHTVRRALLTLEMQDNSQELISSLLKSLLKSLRPIEGPGIVHIFSILSDALPQNYLPDVFRLSCQVFLERDRHFGFDMKMLNWWEDIFRWNTFNISDWDIVDSVLTSLFRNPFYWDTSTNMLNSVLLQAPLDRAKNWSEIISNSKDKDALYPSGMSIVYNASLERMEMKEYALQIFDTIKDVPAVANEIEYYRTILLALDSDKKNMNRGGGKYRAALIDQFINFARSISDRKVKPNVIRMGAVLDWKQYRRINWSSLRHQEWSNIHQAIDNAITNPFINDNEFMTLIVIYGVIARQQKRNLINIFAHWFLDKCLNLEINPTFHPGLNGPWSRGSLKSDVKDPVRHGKTAVMSFILSRVSPTLGNKILAWIQDEIPETEEANLLLFWGMLLELYIMGTITQSTWALNALKAIYSRIVSNDILLAKATDSSYVLLATAHINSRERLVDLLKKKKYEPILDMLDKIIKKLTISPNPDGRRSAALMLHLLSEMGWMNETRMKWAENLRKDSRARVRLAFNK